ncbi:MAG TPA: hypothetical protein VIW29_11025, partial [Polyangiaceae bacterium]
MSVVRQQALTLVAPLIPGREAGADRWLREHRKDLQRALGRSTTTHFARWVLLPPSLDERGRAVGDRHQLAFETNFDGPLAEHVADLRAALGPLLDGAFAGVEGFPGAGDRLALLEFVRSSAARRSAVFYAAHAGLAAPVVRSDARLKLALEARLKQRSLGAVCQADDALELALDLQETGRRVALAEGLSWGPVERGLPPAPTGWLGSWPSWLLAAFARPLAVLAALLAA